jgi:2,3-bisphosphoglycerate-independent phosphoglycerate mutase
MGLNRLRLGYVLLDGCADRPDPKLNYTTPLEAAHTPALDSIATRGRLGRVTTVGRGISPESDIAVFNMLGYAFEEGYPGRGVVEAIGANVKFRDGELALRANFGTVRGSAILDRRAGRNLTAREAEELSEELKHVRLTGATFQFRSTISYRGVLVISAERRLSAQVSNTDPAYRRVGGFGAARQTRKDERLQKCIPESREEAAVAAADLVNEFTKKSLQVLSVSGVNKEREKAGLLPANALLLRDAGDHLPRVRGFEAKYGMKGVAIVEMPAEVGIAKILGMKIIEVEDRNDLNAKASLFSRELKEDTTVYVHIKGPDEFGHDGDAVGKKKCIERIDRDFFSRIEETAGGGRLAVSCDHATPCALKMHSSDPVPLLVTATKARDGARFTEKGAQKGSLGMLLGRDVLRKVLSL